jgi:hypothetical protein
MAHILGVRQFHNALSIRSLREGDTYIVVDGARRKIVATLKVEPNPEQVEENIKIIYTRS